MTQIATPPPAPRRSLYLGLFLITLATLLFQLGLTRIFSVIMYYHMAFFAVSVTLFGIALGGVIVHFFPRVFSAERAQRWMGWMALGFALSIALALLVLINMPFDLTRNSVLLPQLLVVSIVLAVPFTCGGIAVAIALTRFPQKTNLLYGWDLAGAALGCLLFAPLIWALGGPRFILAVAALTALGGLVFMLGDAQVSGRRRAVAAALGMTLLLAALTGASDSISIYHLRNIRGGTFEKERLAFDEWNAISRITALPMEGYADGVAPRLYYQSKSPQFIIQIDTFAATPILPFDGDDFSDLFFPFHDVSYAAHAIVKNPRVAVIGVGGGRDILAAKAWGAPEVVGIEINNRTLEAFTETFAEFAGWPLQWPGVTIVRDEARSYLARSEQQFDIIQASLIDTFAATSAGAFVLTENSLYTLEGWDVFLDRLTDRGVLTMTRWYSPGNPIESIRLLTLARAALEARGIDRPIDHIIMTRIPATASSYHDTQPLATILVKKTPFTPDEVAKYRAWATENDMVTLVSPEGVEAPELAGVMEAADLEHYVAGYPFEISPPTDDQPFFFDVLRWRDILNPEFRQGSAYIYSINLKPVIMLGTLLATVIVMAFAFIVVPLAIEGRRRRAAGFETLPAGRRLAQAVYFIMLGLGYMMIELTLMQRFAIFLGHPGYSLTVCLFTMLLASGLGSMAARRLFGDADWRRATRKLRILNLMLGVALLVTLAAALWVMNAFVAQPTSLRIVLAGLVLAPAGFLMGMPFPLAVQAAAHLRGAPLAWFWGINGAFSVCASVLVVALGHSVGLTGAYVVGAICYLVAGVVAGSFGPRRAASASPLPSES